MNTAKLVLLAAVAAISGCQPGAEEPAATTSTPPAAATVESWDEPVVDYEGGHLTLEQIVARVAEDRRRGRPLPECANPAMGLDGTVDCYHETARDMTLERILDASGELPAASPEMTANDRRDNDLRRVRVLAQQLGQDLDVSEDALRAEYDANPDRFQRPASIVLWNILRRHDDPQQPQATIDLLNEIRQRYQAGETFASLAREYSQSETRLRNGFVGSVQEGRMAEKLEAVAFALDAGEISEPIPVPGGAMLLHVSEKTPGVSFSFEDARAGIERMLRQQRVADAMAERVADFEAPPGSTILDRDQLLATLTAGGDAMILDLGSFQLAASEFAPPDALEDEETHDAFWEAYQGQVRTAQLAMMIDQSDEPWAREIREQIDPVSTSEMRRVDIWVQDGIDALIEAEPDRLSNYFADHQSSYQTPLQFDLVTLEVPLTTAPHERLIALEAIAAQPVAAIDTLQEAAREWDGELTDNGWVEFNSLSEVMPGKAISLIVQTEVGAAMAPYQQDEAIHLHWVRGKREPEPLSFAEARDDVRSDYVRRFAKQISANLRLERLEKSDFSFDEASVRALLMPPESA